MSTPAILALDSDSRVVVLGAPGFVQVHRVNGWPLWNVLYSAEAVGDCDGRVTLDDWHHQDHDEGVLAYDPTWDDCDGEGGPVRTGPRCALSGPCYTPCTYADCDLDLGGGCVLKGPPA